MFNPQILLLDEPTANLSATASNQVMNFIKELTKKLSVIFVTHDLSSVIKYSDRILVMRSGKIVAERLPHETDTVELVRLMRL